LIFNGSNFEIQHWVKNHRICVADDACCNLCREVELEFLQSLSKFRGCEPPILFRVSRPANVNGDDLDKYGTQHDSSVLWSRSRGTIVSIATIVSNTNRACSNRLYFRDPDMECSPEGIHQRPVLCNRLISDPPQQRGHTLGCLQIGGQTRPRQQGGERVKGAEQLGSVQRIVHP
jgi:hypothetical protein